MSQGHRNVWRKSDVNGQASLDWAKVAERPSARGRIPTQVLAQLSVRDGRAAVEFYRRALGAREIYRVGGTDEHPPVVCQLELDGASFWVSDESPEHASFSPPALGGGTVRLLLVVEDPEAAQERAVAAGASAVRPVAVEHGWLLGRIEDPFGHHWEIGKPLGPWPPPGGSPGG